MADQPLVALAHQGQRQGVARPLQAHMAAHDIERAGHLCLLAVQAPALLFQALALAGCPGKLLAELLAARERDPGQVVAAGLERASGLVLAGADALVKLYRDNATTLTPDPLYTAFHASHPPALARIARLAMKAPPLATPPGVDDGVGAR